MGSLTLCGGTFVRSSSVSRTVYRQKKKIYIYIYMREISLSSECAERNSLPPMTVPDPSPVLDKNHPPMSP